MARIAFLSDIHFKYHCRKAWPLALAILPDLNLDRTLLGGDIIDFGPISKFVEHPQQKLDLVPEIAITRKELLRLRKTVRGMPIDYMEGNHEWRLEKYLYRHAPELVGIHSLTVPGLLELKKNDLDIRWHDQMKVIMLGKLPVVHGHRIKVSSIHPAKSTYAKIGGNMLVGHHHKFDRHLQRPYSGKELHGVWCNGTLGTINPDWTFFPQWHQGFTVVEVAWNGSFHVEQIIFYPRGHALCAVVNGKEYKA